MWFAGRFMAEGAVIMRTKTKDRMNKTRMNKARYDELKYILEARRLEIIGEVQDKMRDVRAEGAAAPLHDVRDDAETSEADIQDDIEFALLQMKTETLNKITEALSRLDEGTFGYCFECGKEISAPRLRALPFAVRCTDCEANREIEMERELHVTRRGAVSLFADLAG